MFNRLRIEVGRIYTAQGEWVRPPNKNKKCYWKSKEKYKVCCMSRDKKRLDELIHGKDRTKDFVKIQDKDAQSFLASLVTI